MKENGSRLLDKKEIISIIVPIYNVEKYLPRCLKSIIEQTYPYLEIILVDDGSNDKSGIICDTYQKQDKRIKVIHKQNGGVSSARNTGLKNATGKYIAFVDSDDYIEKNMIEKLYQNLIESKADISICNYYNVKENKKIVNNNNIKEEKIVLRDISGIFSTLKTNDFNYISSLCNKLIKRKIINETQFDEKIYIGEDLLFMTKLLLNSRSVCFENQPYYNYVYHQNSSVHKITNKTLTVFDAHEQVITLLKRKVSNKVIDELIKDEFYWCNMIYNKYKFNNKKEKQKFKQKEKKLYKTVKKSKYISNYIKLKQFIKYHFYSIYKLLERK